MQREIVKFSSDAAQVVRLDFSEGKEVLSKSGSKQWQYTCNRDGAIMWLPLAGKQAIERCGARAGDEVRILKSFLNRETIWTAQVVKPVAPDPPAQSRYGGGNGKVHGFPAAAYHQPETREPAPAPPAQYGREKPTEPVSKPVQGPASHISACLRQAIDAVIDAQEYARQQGFSVTFLGGDVRAIANSLMIGDQKRGERT